MNHTKEPWKIINTGHGGIGVIEGDNHIFVAGVDGRTAQEIMANTNRIVACVNACAGITDEALEAGIVYECVEKECERWVHDENYHYEEKDFEWHNTKVWEDV